MPATSNLQAWVTSSNATVPMGILPINSYVVRVQLHATQAFNSDGTDNISVGITGTTNKFATATDVSTTGVKTVTLGSGVGFQTSAQAVNAYYVNGGSAPTTGKAIVIIEYFIAPPSP